MSLPSPPTPPPIAMSKPLSTTVSGQINTATRKQHTELNRLLMHRLPLALPPHANTPLLYSKGLLPFARIFMLFETEWDLLARHVEEPNDSEHERAVKAWLIGLRPDGLPRTARIKNDMTYLRDLVGPDMFATPDLGEQWMQQMRSSIRQKPHTLVAFAWVFYMAVFSGGRWIRQQLGNGGSQFWTQRIDTVTLTEDDRPPSLELPGFSFLSFPGDQDGEDLKAGFKFHLVEAETLLTSEERLDIIDVSQQLFGRSIGLVKELDRTVLMGKVHSYLWNTLRWTSISAALFISLRYIARSSGFL